MARGLGRHDPLRTLARGRAAGDRGPRRARHRPDRRRRGVPRAGAGRRRRLRRRRARTRARSPITTSPRSSTSCRRAIGPPAGSWIHYGLTSVGRRRHRAVLDDARRRRRRAGDDRRAAVARSSTLARTHRDTVMIGRTHGIHAEPTTFGAKVALWALQVDRDRERLARGPAVGRGVQAVGRRRHVLQHRSRGRGVRRRPPRADPRAGHPGDRPRSPRRVPLGVCRRSAATCELIAVELRHLQRTEVREVQEGFKAGPEGLVGDAPQAQPDLGRDDQRTRPGRCAVNLQAGMQDVALWHERDISHSSVERVVLPDSSTLVDYMCGVGSPGCCSDFASMPNGCGRTCGRRTAWCSASPFCWRWWPPERAVTTPIGSCSATR